MLNFNLNKEMKNKILITFLTSSLIAFSSCESMLDYTPKGVLSSSDLTAPTAVEGLVTSAYAAFGNGDKVVPI